MRMTADLQVPSLSMSGAVMLFPFAVNSTFGDNFKTEAVNTIKFIFSFSGSLRPCTYLPAFCRNQCCRYSEECSNN